MGHPVSTRFVASSAVAGSWLVALAIAGRPFWLAGLLGLAVVLVWAAPFLPATNRKHPEPAPAAPTISVVRPPEVGPGS
jgi:hypothetical protein